MNTSNSVLCAKCGHDKDAHCREVELIPGGSKRELCCRCSGYEAHYGKAWHRFQPILAETP